LLFPKPLAILPQIASMNFFIRVLITTVNAFILQSILPGIKMDDFFTALLFALLLGLLDAFVKPILILLTLPATIFTLGLFLFAINAFMVLIGDYFIDSFHVDGFWHAMLFSILLSFFNSFVHKKAMPKQQKKS
jgi:putative membrane protein